ncbi:MAG: NAD-dependent epimerase/dehydratase family protein [Candidatus Aminicenantaceae bacterium]
MKAFVTGGTGFIGSNLIEFLLKKGFQITALIRNLNDLKWLKGLEVNFLEGDLFSIPSLPSDIKYVFHLAGLTKTFKSAKYYTVNHLGTASLFQSLISQNIYPDKFIYLSSLAAAGPSLEGKSVTENDTPHPITPYGRSKLKGEEEALKNKDIFPVVILRAGAVFGPRDRDFLRYFKFARKGILPTLRSSERLLSLCYVKDFVSACYLCTQKELDSGEIINIADPQPYHWDEMGKAAGKALGKKLREIAVPLPIMYLYALIAELAGKITRKPSIFNRDKFKEGKQPGWVADVRKAEKKLTFRTQYSLEDAIKETIQWYIKNHWL